MSLSESRGSTVWGSKMITKRGRFRNEAESLLYLNNKLLFHHCKLRSKELHQSFLTPEAPMDSIFITEREKCRLRQKLLVLEGKFQVFLVYHSELTIGIYLGS